MEPTGRDLYEKARELWPDTHRLPWSGLSMLDHGRWSALAELMAAQPAAEAEPERTPLESVPESLWVEAGGLSRLQLGEPIHLWYAEDRDACGVGFGDEASSVGQAPYVRADVALALAAVREAAARGTTLPESVRRAWAEADLHECWVNGDTADVLTNRYKGCANFDQIVARCATGDLWRKRAVVIAEALNYVREQARLGEVPAEDRGPWVVSNGDPDDPRYRMWSGRAWIWTRSLSQAMRFARRSDAQRILPEGEEYHGQAVVSAPNPLVGEI